MFTPKYADVFFILPDKLKRQSYQGNYVPVQKTKTIS